LKVMGKGNGNIVHALAMASRKRYSMNKKMMLIPYYAAKSVYQKWFKSGIINEEELKRICILLAEKYGIQKGSIYR